MAPRPTWKGLLQISRVTIPIKVFPATESSESLSFNQLHSECQTRLTQRRWCLTCGREVPSAEVVKGYEFEKGKYVQLLDAELDAVKPESTRVIDLTRFVRPAELELRAIDRAYYLAPDGRDGGQACEAYALMGAAMAGYLGIGKLAIYGREYLVAVDPFRGSLLMYTLHHAAELREPPYRVEHPETFTRVMPSAGRAMGTPELKVAQQVIAALAGPLHLTDFRDDYQADVRRLIADKIAGNEILIPLTPPSAPVVNLKEALEQSLAAVRSGSKKPMAKAGLKRAR